MVDQSGGSEFPFLIGQQKPAPPVLMLDRCGILQNVASLGAKNVGMGLLWMINECY